MIQEGAVSASRGQGGVEALVQGSDVVVIPLDFVMLHCVPAAGNGGAKLKEEDPTEVGGIPCKGSHMLPDGRIHGRAALWETFSGLKCTFV